ncbi:MAG: hypothetical protein ABFC24_04145 [Methanoregulaceae archaeon]
MKRSGLRALFAAGIFFLVLTIGVVAGTAGISDETISGNISSESVSQVQSVVAVPIPAPTPISQSGGMTGNISRLEISPTYTNFALAPGETKETTVTIRNRDSEAVTVEPVVRQTSYAGPNLLDASWISVNPALADIPPGESRKFTITTTIPSDVMRGYYYGSVAFTNETYPSPYPQPVPNYIHAMSLSLNVISQPVVLVSTPYISDQLEAGKDYHYDIVLRNSGTSAVPIDPVLRSDSYPMYGLYGSGAPYLNESAFRISAPASIPAGSNETVTLSLKVPPGMNGYFNGYLDLGIDDPAMLEGEDRVQINFQVWSQPPGSFVKEFSLDSAEPVSVELSSVTSGYGIPVPGSGSKAGPVPEPSFDANLAGPEGNAPLTLVQKVIKGTVNAGGSGMPYGASADSYQEVSSQYIFTYTAQGTPGTWKLMVTPKNTQSFDYKITRVSGQNTTATSGNLLQGTGPGLTSLPASVESFIHPTNQTAEKAGTV